jgi:NAD(P)-dependent dehydrogenase (short-subunit alcohol dehydrogenase family)
VKGKRVLITGATSGIGRVAARELSRLGASVVALGRDAGKLAELKRELGVETLQCDLSSLADVRRAAAEYKERFPRLDVLLNNAGGISGARALTRDGYETTFAVNHLAYFLLTKELLGVLRTSAPSRIVNVASEASRAPGAGVRLDDLQNQRWSKMGSYGRSKRQNLLFTFELARRLEGTGVTVNALHPGVVKSGFGAQAGWFKWAVRLAAPFMLTPEQGADTAVWLASAPELEGKSGGYWFKRKPLRAVGQAYDQDLQRGLWEASEKLVSSPSPATAPR